MGAPSHTVGSPRSVEMTTKVCHLSSTDCQKLDSAMFRFFRPRCTGAYLPFSKVAYPDELIEVSQRGSTLPVHMLTQTHMPRSDRLSVRCASSQDVVHNLCVVSDILHTGATVKDP